ncbi:PP2C family protein-serine/threonine phosphatase [Streptomyces profundus]|uniref:PP2C family protein-serine/threonine phosphatase n=1 Tax=Streptomyces profundus TaxID=2867410 RepID=UPI001D16A2BF|nr:SpoIIE family protein phosphatase [Streptomyces sp. MA3_2.13]UED87874.1 SpoIIE family protein phosphatase [Streptomyces sp. MA3_2.13]
MTDIPIDYAAVFRSSPAAIALLTTDLRFVDASDVYLEAAGRTKDEVIGRLAYEAFPDNPGDERTSGTNDLRQSMERVLATRERDVMAVQRYDVECGERSGEWAERYWSIVNTPVLGPDGEVALLLNRIEEVTELVEARGRGHPPEARDHVRRLESDLLARAGELQHVNEELREAHARSRQVALALQEAMLPAPDLLVPRDSAVRYRPASAVMNVCGDWYDLIDLDAHRTSVAVGDVVGHGLGAAGVMGQLRSALSALARVAAGPAQALEVLDLYSRSVTGAQSSTVVKIHVDWRAQVLTYSCAGHLPPLLARGRGRVEFMDRATNPPLGTLPERGGAVEAAVSFEHGDVLVVYTDGLVERRDEDIDQGLERLATSLARHRDRPAESLADTLLADLLPGDDTEDDTALVILRL